MIDLIAKAKKIRKRILDISFKAGKGHFGGTFSVVDILVALYYGINFDLDGRLFIGKGHACLALYCILEDLGIVKTEDLLTYGQDGSYYNVQFDVRIPTIRYNTGSLGNVVGIAAGVALANKLDGDMSRPVFAIIGDGECSEGSIWESISFAVEQRLTNLIVVVDSNKLSVTEVVDDPRLQSKFEAFGCTTCRVNGHNYDDLASHLFCAGTTLSPLVIIADTIKGKGVSFMEGDVRWHHSSLNEIDYKRALEELEMG